MGTNLREQILSEENIYKAIFAVESYVSERDLLSVSDLNKFLQLRDKYDFNGTILTVINSCKKTLTKLLDDENELLKVNVFFKISLSKSIIDRIDEIIAQYYSFTDEELDFIINYDIKYRMGDELND